jgi:UPF0755 protein
VRRSALLAGSFLLIAACGIVGAVVYGYQLLTPRMANAESQSFVVAKGEGLSQIARKLEDAGLVRSASATQWLARMRDLQAELKAGEYNLSADMSTQEIIQRLAAGRVRTYQLSVPEGMRIQEIAQRLGDAGLAEPEELLALVYSPEFARSLGIEADGLEGYLYPETYHFARGLPPEEILRTLVDQFKRVWKTIEEDASRTEMSMHEVVTLASIIEKETAAPDERPLIAAVFLNRLDRGMRLETDPAVIYGIEDFDGNLRRRDLVDSTNPYNTYRIFGLPPGPIASPGKKALQAVVEPADSDYLYFVSRNDGSHHFSVSYRDHVNAVNRYQKGGRGR